MASKPSSMPPIVGARGPIVNRQLAPPGSTRIARLKPSLRDTVESGGSSGSQADALKPEQTMIIFDWDDTLCPSTWIRENRLSFFRPAPAEERYRRPLRDLQAKALALLSAASQLGKVIIVTNAMEPWIETSCKNFLPELWPQVSVIPMIYARSIYETKHCGSPTGAARNSRPGCGGAGRQGALPGLYAPNGQNKLGGQAMRPARQLAEIDPQAWKELAFTLEIGSFYSQYKNQSWKNIVSIGDAVFERDALRQVVLQRPSMTKLCRTKTVKLLDDPDIGELSRQLILVNNIMTVAVQHDGDLEVEIDEEDLKLEESLLNKLMA